MEELRTSDADKTGMIEGDGLLYNISRPASIFHFLERLVSICNCSIRRTALQSTYSTAVSRALERSPQSILADFKVLNTA
jgi:hypothetical protein